MSYFGDIIPVISQNIDALRATGALAARPGFMLDEDGYPTQTRAVVLIADPNVALANVPDSLGGLPIDVRMATPAQIMQFTQPAAFADKARFSLAESVPDDFPGLVLLREGVAPLAVPVEAAPGIVYTPPPGANYDPIQLRNVTMICSCSPDNGWSVLEAFIQATSASLTTAMYDFTSAHIEQTVATSLEGKPFKLVLDHPPKNPTADETDEQTVAKLTSALGSTFTQTWALTPSDPDGGTPIFQTSYHIKVSARDIGRTNVGVWISSGNWNNSNQPVFDWTNPDKTLARKSDRDWHVVFFSQELAAWFASFIEHDFDVAQAENANAARAHAIVEALPPPPPAASPIDEFVGPITLTESVTVTPLLTPDAGVYVDAILDLINGTQRSFDLQLQYINSFAADPKFADLIAALARVQHNEAIVTRIILGNNQQSENLELMQEAGMLVDRAHVRIQNNVHNKGMLVDGVRTVVSSQNWSGAGVLRNRDAGVIIESAQVNAYFQARFDYDWTYQATAKPRQAKTGGTENGGDDS